MQIYVVNLFQGCTFPHSKCYSHNWKKARISFRMVLSCHLTYCPLKRASLSLLSLPPKFCHNNQSLSLFSCPPPFSPSATKGAESQLQQVYRQPLLSPLWFCCLFPYGEESYIQCLIKFERCIGFNDNFVFNSVK